MMKKTNIYDLSWCQTYPGLQEQRVATTVPAATGQSETVSLDQRCVRETKLLTDFVLDVKTL